MMVKSTGSQVALSWFSIVALTLTVHLAQLYV